MSTRFERIVGNEPDPPKTGEMPPWVHHIYNNPCPYQDIVQRLERRLFGPDKTGSHHVWYDLSEGYSEGYTYVRREEFLLKRYGILGILHIHVVVPGVAEQIEIYSTNYAGGWRAGPWWSRLDALVKKWSKEADEYDAEQERKKQSAAEAERQKQNGIFQAYLAGNHEGKR